MADAVPTAPEATSAESPEVLAAILAPKTAQKAQAASPEPASPPPVTEIAEEETPPADAPEPAGDEKYLEEEAASEEEPQGEIDPDEVEYELKVDDAPVKVKLKDLKASFSGQVAVEKRLQEAAERRSQAEQVGHALYNTLSEQSQRLSQLDEFLKESAPQVDWNKLRATDPQGYLIAKERQRDIEDRRRSLSQEQQRVQAEQTHLTEMANQAYSEEQARKLMDRMPELADPEKSRPALERLTSGAVDHYGFTSHEVAAVMDHRALLVLNDAIKYRELLARKAEATKGGNGAGKPSPTAVKTLLRPGNATPSGSEFSARMTAAKAEKAAVENARKVGSVDAIADMLIVRAKK